MIISIWVLCVRQIINDFTWHTSFRSVSHRKRVLLRFFVCLREKKKVELRRWTMDSKLREKKALVIRPFFVVVNKSHSVGIFAHFHSSWIYDYYPCVCIVYGSMSSIKNYQEEISVTKQTLLIALLIQYCYKNPSSRHFEFFSIPRFVVYNNKSAFF